MILTEGKGTRERAGAPAAGRGPLVLLALALCLIYGHPCWAGTRSDRATPPPPPAIRMLVVETEAEAREAAAQVAAGVPLDQIVRARTIGPQRGRGGYLGRVDPASLAPAARAALAKTRRGRLSPVFVTENGFGLIQVLTERDEQEQEARIKREPEAQALLDQGTELGKAGDLEGAVALLRQAVEANPGLADAHFNLGIALWRLGRAEEAIGVMRETVRLTPTDIDAHLRLGAWLLGRGRPVEASRHYERAATLQMDAPEIWQKLGQSYEAAGNPRAAMGAYQQALRLMERENAATLESLLRVATQAEDGPSAVDAARRLKPFRPGHEGFLIVGDALLLNKEPAAAVREFQMAVALTPSSPRPHVGLAAAYLQLKESDAAAEHLLTAIRLRPEDPAPYQRLSRIYAETGRVDLAIVVLRDGLGVAGGLPRALQADLAAELASLYARAGMAREAERERQRAAALRGQ
jgi:tetratricopeptide (TPR) repeat protein